MFTWICPKCGGEVPPSYNECPRCSGQTAATPASSQASSAVGVPPVQQTGVPPPPAAAPAPVAFAPPPPARQERKLSPIVVGIGAAVVIAALLGALYLFVLPRRPAEIAGTQTPLQPARPAQSNHPLAKHLEVVGVRIVESAGGTAKIQFLVVNHSAADLPELKMDVSLRAGDRDVFTFPVAIPSIGPYEYRELSTTIKTELKPYELPDWQVIRPEFTLTSEP